jgi:hypothetical protein
MRHPLPRKISVDIHGITAATWNQLVDCVAYAMDHPRGDGHHILYDAMDGMLKLNMRHVGRVSNGEEAEDWWNYSPMKYVDYGEWNLNTGLSVELHTYAHFLDTYCFYESDCAPQRAGYICAFYNPFGSIYHGVATPGTSAYPLAYYEVQNLENGICVVKVTDFGIKHFLNVMAKDCSEEED